MLLNESTQTGNELDQKIFRERVLKEGMELWKKQQEHERRRKLHEQKEMREMLDRYWPWGRASDARPRGLRNLRVEELFPDKDYQNAKRFVGTLDLGRGGGGAPMVRDGRKVTRTREDPLLRFQFGSKDLRRCVDNTLRYKTDKDQQQEYKKQLDKLVEEKKLKIQKEKKATQDMERGQFLKSPPWGKKGPGGAVWRHHSTIGLNFLKSLGWSTEKTLQEFENEKGKQDEQMRKDYDKFQRMKVVPPNRVVKVEPVIQPRKNFICTGKNRKLSPLSNEKDNGVELVALLARDRKNALRIPLSSTDVTSDRKFGNPTIWNRHGSSYLKELTQQVVYKQQRLKEIKAQENEVVHRHFTTWDGFWGRPGNGAPTSEIKRQCLGQLLYPQRIPIGVH